MSSITLGQAPYAGWKDAFWLQRPPLALICVPQVGGRIMGVRWGDRDLYWVNEALAGSAIDTAAMTDPVRAKTELGFKLWGGNKTWLAPQDRWSAGLPFVDLDSGSYKLAVIQSSSDLAVVEMRSRTCRETGIQVIRRLTLSNARPGWRLTHRLENQGRQTVRWAPWSNTMVPRPVRVFLPTRSDSAFPQGVKTFDAEGDAKTARPEVVSRLGDLAVVECCEPMKFKYGVDSDRGSLLAIFLSKDPPYIGLRQTFPTFPPKTYGHGCSVEVFNASDFDYLELETHGAVCQLSPGDSIEFTEIHQAIEMSQIPQTAEAVNQIFESNRFGI